MISAVNSGGNGFQGGMYVPSGRPTVVGGQGFGTPGTAASTPPGVPSSGIIEARNNRGSNIRIPYARLVPLHSRDGYKSLASGKPADKRQVLVNGKPALEYDGLRNGELAWILGRRFKAINPDLGNAGALNTSDAPVGGGPTAIDELTDSQRYAHQAYAGLGNGVDRMQRLASTDWVESLIKTKLGSSRINLHAINLGSDYSKAMDSTLATYAPFIAGSTAMHTLDVTFSMAAASGNQAAVQAVGPEQKQGILVYEAGPFLRGVQASYAAIEIRDILGTSSSQDVARNMGDTLTFSGLDAELRRRNLTDWTPDGIVLSKLESPTDEPMKSIEMDARSAQLFNVAIQGPAISTSWTSDVRDYKLECQPMDKVFICVVADLSWVTDTNTMTNPVNAARQARTVADRAIGALDAARRTRPVNQQAVRNAKQLVATETANCLNAANAVVAAAVGAADVPQYDALVAAWLTAKANLETAEDSPIRPIPQGTIDAFNNAERAMVAALGGWSTGPNPADKVALDAELDEMEQIQNAMRKGDTLVSKATLTNFRLMRTTSSHMANYSQWKPGTSTSRMGLRLGKARDIGQGDYDGAGEYIIGGWCIGTVIDSAASRSTVGTLVRTAPTSMALNVAVNIEWWSGDKLYKHYMDDSGLTLMRGQPSTALIQRKAGVAGSGIVAGTKRTRAAADVDVDASDAQVAEFEDDEEITAEQRAAAGFEPLGRRAPGSSALPGASATVPPTAAPATGRRAGGAARR